MAEAEEAFSRISRVRSDGRPDKAVIAKGATQAATICASSELVSPKALGLVKCVRQTASRLLPLDASCMSSVVCTALVEG